MTEKNHSKTFTAEWSDFSELIFFYGTLETLKPEPGIVPDEPPPPHGFHFLPVSDGVAEYRPHLRDGPQFEAEFFAQDARHVHVVQIQLQHLFYYQNINLKVVLLHLNVKNSWVSEIMILPSSVFPKACNCAQ